MPAFIALESLVEETPDGQALREVLQDALDQAIELDLDSINIVLHYARINQGGREDRLREARSMAVPANSDAAQVAREIIQTFTTRAPGNGFVGRIELVILDPQEAGTPLGTFERFVTIGEDPAEQGYDPGYGQQQPGGGYGHDPYGGYPPGIGPYGPPAPGPGPMGGYGPPNMPPGGFFDPTMYGQGEPDSMSIEERGMALAQMGGNERRLDMLLQQNRFLVQTIVNQNFHNDRVMQHYLQLNGLVMGRALPAMDFRDPNQGADNPIAGIIGGLLQMWMSRGGAAAQGQQAVEPPPVPKPHLPGNAPAMGDAFRPYQPPAEEVEITAEAAQAWAKQNPKEAAGIARDLLPPAMQALIPK